MRLDELLRRLQRIATVTLPLSLALSAPSARAEGIVLDFNAPAACPTRDEWIQTLRTLSKEASIVDEGGDPSARRFAVRVIEESVRERAEFEGSVTIDGRTRTLRDAACAPLAKALALVVAQTLDPRTTPGAEAAKVEEEPRKAAPAKPEARAFSLSFGTTTQLSFLAAPNEILGIGGYGEVALVRGLAPSVRVSVAPSLASRVSSGEGAVRFQFWTGALDVCPTRFDAARWLALLPCVRASTGVLTAEGEALPNSRSKTTFWLAGGAAVRARVHAKAFHFELGAGLLAPVTRQEFTRTSGPFEYRAPPVYALVETSLGVTF